MLHPIPAGRHMCFKYCSVYTCVSVFMHILETTRANFYWLFSYFIRACDHGLIL